MSKRMKGVLTASLVAAASATSAMAQTVIPEAIEAEALINKGMADMAPYWVGALTVAAVLGGIGLVYRLIARKSKGI